MNGSETPLSYERVETVLPLSFGSLAGIHGEITALEPTTEVDLGRGEGGKFVKLSNRRSQLSLSSYSYTGLNITNRLSKTNLNSSPFNSTTFLKLNESNSTIVQTNPNPPYRLLPRTMIKWSNIKNRMLRIQNQGRMRIVFLHLHSDVCTTRSV